MNKIVGTPLSIRMTISVTGVLTRGNCAHHLQGLEKFGVVITWDKGHMWVEPEMMQCTRQTHNKKLSSPIHQQCPGREDLVYTKHF